MKPELFHSAFELNDHGFILMEHSPTSPTPHVVYANPAYRRLAAPAQPGDRADADGPPPTAASEALPLVVSSGAPASLLSYEEAWKRWIHLYLFLAADPIAGAFVTDPTLLSASNEKAGTEARFGDLVIDYRARRVSMDGNRITLTRTEYELLALLSKAPNHVLTRQQVLSGLWGTAWLGSSPALDVHVSRLRRKLGESGTRPRHVHSIRGIGLLFVPDPDQGPD